MVMRWEQYKKCDASLVPPSTRWDRSAFSPLGYVVWYGGPEILRKRYAYGAPFRRIHDAKKNLMIYYRHVTGLSAPKEKEVA